MALTTNSIPPHDKRPSMGALQFCQANRDLLYLLAGEVVVFIGYLIFSPFSPFGG
jgi:hypothetical protein